MLTYDHNLRFSWPATSTNKTFFCSKSHIKFANGVGCNVTLLDLMELAGGIEILT